ncbi:Leucine-rich repeats and immunoglobulin-like domain protein, partial [Halocaridina rubra]
NLSRNKIKRLDSRSFKSLSSLVELKLSRNLLTSSTFNRSAPVFSNLTNLMSLDLNGNRIHSLPGLMFEHLKRLRELKLRRNQITTFSDGAFYGLEAMEKLLLDHNNITTVQKGWLFGLRSLKLLSVSHNQIDSIRPGAWEPTELLDTIDLGHNRLVSLRVGTFRSLRKLTKLTLGHNLLAHIENNTFAPTPSLKLLDLSNNQLRWSIEDNSGAFNSLNSLESLSLAYNGIETVHVKTFAPLESVVTLDLRGNQLRTLPHNPFAKLKHLSTIHMNTSNLVCDCYLSWFPKWLTGVNFNSSTMRALCNYPPSLKDHPVASVSDADFSCESSPRPIISHFPKDDIALRGENITLACVAQASTEGDQPKFFWRKNNELLVNFEVETLVSVIGGDGKGGAIHNVTSLLKLKNVTDEDSGDYQCVVRNRFGSSYSQRANLRVHVFPYFTKKPQSVVVQVGNVAKLECAVAGSPPPDMTLLKDGGDDFPAARERRIHAYPNENVFYIKPVQPHDQGKYTCKATNEAGTATTNASITVRQTPEFAKPLQDRVARLGDNAVLECQGTGQPSPKLSWIKNGVTLEEGGRYVLVQDSQYLLILETQMDDAGTYVCELTNILGTVRGHVNLSIKRDITASSTTTGIVMMAVVCCVVITSLVWVVIIYQTRKRAQTAALGPPGGYPVENGVGRYPSHLSAHPHLPPDLVHSFTPLLTNPQDAYPTTAPDSGSEHSSGKDSGTGDSAQRSNEDLLPIELTRAGLRRSLIVCADPGSATVLRGVSTVNVGPNGEILGCEDQIGRPRLSTFSSNRMSSGGYSPNHYTATLRYGSNSRLVPVPTPVTPAATLPRSRPLLHHHGSFRKPNVTAIENPQYYAHKVIVPQTNRRS